MAQSAHYATQHFVVGVTEKFLGSTCFFLSLFVFLFRRFVFFIRSLKILGLAYSADNALHIIHINGFLSLFLEFFKQFSHTAFYILTYFVPTLLAAEISTQLVFVSLEKFVGILIN